MTINVLQHLHPSSPSSLFFLLLLAMCTIAMKLATSPPATCGAKTIQSSWNCDQDFHCLEAGRPGSTWATMFLVMSTCTTLVRTLSDLKILVFNLNKLNPLCLNSDRHQISLCDSNGYSTPEVTKGFVQVMENLESCGIL